MPLIRCPKCGQAYDVPGVIAVRLPNSIATCHCGEWLAGSKAAVLARMMNPDKLKEVDLQPYRVETTAPDAPAVAAASLEPAAPRSIRVVARGAKESVNTVFTLKEYPLLVGRKGCHVELAEAELSLRHCSIAVRGTQLVVRDLDSHMGTFLDGQQIEEAVIGDGVHVLRVGSALITIEPTEERGEMVRPMTLDETPSGGFDSELLAIVNARVASESNEGKRAILVCIDGPLNGQEFEIPPTGLTVGREGHVRVPDEFLSRKHFEVLPDEDGTIRVKDLGSRNGTFLNTLPARNTKVHPGDEIRAGVNRFRVERRA
ncbi:MAG TPA: FHA domain-containing protein [Thermoanaerobaculia bacterium]|jgi:pSer/pThr/pTyr-binding forkhead associated (FHA) protein